MCLYPDQEGLEGSHDGGVEVPVVSGQLLHGLELNELTHQVHGIPAVTVTYTRRPHPSLSRKTTHGLTEVFKL